ETTGFSRERFLSAQSPGASREGSDEELRRLVESKAHLRLAKSVVNRILSFFRLGDTLKGTFCKA
ncbi:hypothetical protein ACI4BF_27960, partial [Klebsiella pneumoniae]|uniref:hypothetical protein n=1 Tax=Klebsiella pneumoniae TaxID=573 RepID=UPI003852155D